MKILQRYQCEICGTVYDERADAENCAAQGVKEPIVLVGEFVVTEETYGRFGWYDGDSTWVIEREKDFRGDDYWSYSLIYVITAITNADERVDGGGWHLRRHDLCYHLATKAMTGKKGYRSGFTFPETHLRIHKIKANLDASDLVGERAEFLL